ncbi:TPA: xanthine dehydrogenase molybdopterin binding subunit [Burkholderia cenocepacia]|nr:xanthine dehydrogenase molybdopterin binding subunit [Burkholderia cenocepacia]
MNQQAEPFLSTLDPQADAAQVHVSRAHESAHLHVSGRATYTDDIPLVAGTLHAALGLSAKPHAKIVSMNFDAVRATPGVVAVFTADDIPGVNDCGPIIHDDPVLAKGVVQFVGQPMFIVVATSHETARLAARRAQVDYEELPAILTAQEARKAETYVIPPLKLARGDAAARLAVAPHNVLVECRRMGGGFGGKESQSGLFACCAALAAWKLLCPVKLRPDRDDDMMITGKRHDFHYRFDVGYDDDGRIDGVALDMTSRCGFSADLSGPVMTRAVCHFDNAYWLGDVDIAGYCGKTNTQSNTAFRGFGGPQGAFAIEYILDDIARSLGRDPLDVRYANLYGKTERNVTPYGQTVEDNVLQELLGELETTSDYRARRAGVRAFNARNTVLKKGIALTPVKFGIAFNVTHFNQAGALVHIYTDGSVLVNHGGTEMGQGLNTKVAQVVAHELGIRFGRIRVTATDTSKVANTSATAASTGSDLNGKAAQDAARQLRERLAVFAAKQFGDGKVDAADVKFGNDVVWVGGHGVPFGEVIAKAYLARVQLWSDGFYATPKLHWDQSKLQGRPFYYYSYGAAVSEVVIDTLTGEMRTLRVDALHDVGASLNPALDIGQVEGAFIQGMGWLTTEELWWNPGGKLMTHAPSTYKIPTVNDTPPEFNVRLFQNRNVEDSIHRSKAVGEPPLLLPFSVFFAVRDAVAAVGDYQVNPPLDAPATGESILRAIGAVRAASAARAG